MMDVDQAFSDMLVAFNQGDWSDAYQHSDAILRWLSRGGFTPQLTVAVSSKQSAHAADLNLSRQLAVATCEHVRQIASSGTGKTA